MDTFFLCLYYILMSTSNNAFVLLHRKIRRLEPVCIYALTLLFLVDVKCEMMKRRENHVMHIICETGANFRHKR